MTSRSVLLAGGVSGLTGGLLLAVESLADIQSNLASAAGLLLLAICGFAVLQLARRRYPTASSIATVLLAAVTVIGTVGIWSVIEGSISGVAPAAVAVALWFIGAPFFAVLCARAKLLPGAAAAALGLMTVALLLYRLLQPLQSGIVLVALYFATWAGLGIALLWQAFRSDASEHLG